MSFGQEMKEYLNKNLAVKVGSICEETPDDNPCAGLQVYLRFTFDEENVNVSEVEISSCDTEYPTELGKYTWELLDNREIAIAFDPERTKGTFAENIKLDLRKTGVFINVTYLSGSTSEFILEEHKLDEKH